jgi:fumarate reductase subunit C
MVHPSNGKASKHFNRVYPQFSLESRSVYLRYMYRRIQSIWVIYCSLFLLAGDTHDVQLATRDVYEVGVQVFIYSHTRS